MESDEWKKWKILEYEETMKIGATGKYPEGSLGTNDEGGLAVYIESDESIVRINFGKPVSWLGMPKEEATNFALLILQHSGVKIEPVVMQ